MVRAHRMSAPTPRAPRIVPNAGRPAHGITTKAGSIHVFSFARAAWRLTAVGSPNALLCSAMLNCMAVRSLS